MIFCNGGIYAFLRPFVKNSLPVIPASACADQGLQFFLLGGNPLFIFLCRPPFNIRCRVVFLIVRFGNPVFAIGANAIGIVEKDVGA